MSATRSGAAAARSRRRHAVTVSGFTTSSCALDSGSGTEVERGGLARIVDDSWWTGIFGATHRVTKHEVDRVSRSRAAERARYERSAFFAREVAERLGKQLVEHGSRLRARTCAHGT
jgi:hypothetical protein